MSLNKIRAFIKRDFSIEVSYRLSFFLRLARILVTVLIFYFISKLFGKGASEHLQEYGGEYFPFVLIGIAFSGYLMFGLRSFSESIRQEQMMGTLEAVLVTPTRVSIIVIGASIWNFVFSSITVFIYLLLGVVLFGVDLSSMNLVSGVIILILTILSFSSIGIISAAFVIMLKKGDPLTWFMGTCFSFLGGVYFPVDIMPKFLQVFSSLLPITYSLRSLRLALLKGYGLNMLLPDIVPLFIFCVLLMPISIGLFKLALKKARIDGSLVHY
ncbi:MAG: ABC transporter permease [Candidatus Omnitrophica bacterium]|nr:ABC transporter permease [Candidatus Omnitrophota bacterium]